jgi:peroxiredoxin
MKKIVWLAGILLLAVALTYLKLHILDQVPNINVTTITGQHIDLQQLRGKPVLVTFWATDCVSCVQEIPDLVGLYNRYHSQGFELIAIAMTYDPPNHVVELSHAMQLPYPITLDITGEYALAFGQVKLTPTTFLIAPDGSIVWQQTGKFALADLQARIESLLKG